VGAWGGQCAIKSLPAIWKCEEMGQRLGIDAISASSTIAFAMELYQRGLITTEDTDGLELEWGNEGATIALLERIARRQGFGDVLADGAITAAARIGRGAEDYAIAVKGLEIKQTDPRTSHRAWAFGDLTSMRGGDNIRTTHVAVLIPTLLEDLRKAKGMEPEEFAAWYIGQLDVPDEVKAKAFGVPPRIALHSWEGAAAITKWYEELSTAMNALGNCILENTLTAFKSGPTYYAPMLAACTGWDISPQELMEAGERIINLQRVYLARHGVGRKDDGWPKRFFAEKVPQAPGKEAGLCREDVERVLDEYYELRGWDTDTGWPREETLRRLGLGDVMG